MEQNYNEMVPFVSDYIPYLDDDETECGEIKIGFSKEPFDPSKVLCSTKLEEIDKLLGVDNDAYLKATKERDEKLRAAGSPWVDCPRKTPTGAFNIPTLDESLYWEYVAGIITLEDAAREFCKNGWDNYVNCNAAMFRFARIDEKYHKL